MQLLDGQGLPAPSSGGRWRLVEATVYRCRGAADVWCDGVALERTADGDALLDTGHRVGHMRLHWQHGTLQGVLDIDIDPRPEKLPAELWLQLVEELEAWLPSVTLGFSGVRHGGLTQVGMPKEWLAEAALPLLPLLETALATLAAHLRQQQKRPLLDRPLRSVRRADRPLVQWLARHPAAAAWMDPWQSDAGRPPVVPQRIHVDTFDHPCNRYMHWLVQRLASRLFDVAAAFPRAVQDDTGRWHAARAEALRAAAARLGQALARSPLAQVRPQPCVDAALHVVSGDPVYARVHRLARLLLSPHFALAEQDLPASIRPSYGLYELWCAFALTRDLQCLPGFTWEVNGGENLLNPASSGNGFRVTGTSVAGVLTLRFNHSFANYAARKGKDCWSLSAARRPDFVVGWQSPRRQAWVVLDAKYRVGEQLVEAFDSLHLYRDALRWGSAGGACRAGALLTPARTADAEDHFGHDYQQCFGLAAFELRPGCTTAPLVEWMLDVLECRDEMLLP